jgi:hypothetical protein
MSIAGNIAAGFGRGHKKDQINFYFFSYSGKTVGYFLDVRIKPIGEKCMKVAEELNKIIKGLT